MWWSYSVEGLLTTGPTRLVFVHLFAFQWLPQTFLGVGFFFTASPFRNILKNIWGNLEWGINQETLLRGDF